MFERRDVKLDIIALGLLALVVFLGLAIFSYDRSDSPAPNDVGTLVFPPDHDIQNICGRAGAWIADRSLRVLGVGAYYLVISLAIFDAFLLLRRPINQQTIRLTGWLVSLWALATLATMLVPAILSTGWSGPELGPGGVIGAVGNSFIQMHFATAGAFILVLTLLAAGLLMCTDYVLLQLGIACVGRPARALIRTSQAVSRMRHGHDADRDEAAAEDDAYDDEEEEPDEEDGEISVRILGRKGRSEAAEEEDLEDEEVDEYETDEVEDATNEQAEEDETDDTEEDTEEDEVPEAAIPKRRKKSRAGRIASALRIKKPPTSAEREAMLESLENASHDDHLSDYELPGLDLLIESEDMQFEAQEKEVRRKAKMLEKTFGNFGFNVKVVEIETGPVIAQYEIELEAGLRLSKITGLADDIAIALRVPSVRIVAPIPGKNTVGIEVPNTERQLVRLREVMEEESATIRKMKIPVFLGKDVSGKPMTVDLATLPHLLIAGRTGTGKSVCLNSIITSMVMTRRPDEVKMLMIDPKMVELSPYKRLPHLMHPVVTDMKKAEAILAWAVDKMEERYSLLASAGVRHLSSYNELGEEELMERIQPESEEQRQSIPLHLPYIVIIADEIADLMMTSAKEVEGHIIRLAQKSRAVGIHLVLATQKPTVDVITGLIKSNLPARIAFQVASRTDSRVVLDEMGADKLLGNGDMLFLWPGTSTLLRGQGTFLTDDEITKVVDAVATTEPQFVNELVQLKPAGAEDGDTDKFKSRDDLYEAAIDVVVREGRGSVSLLQRTLGIGYGRGARLIDFMAEDGIVGPYNGSQAREVLVSPEQWATMNGEQSEDPPPPTKSRRGTIRLADESDDETYAEFADDDDGAIAEETAAEAEEESEEEYEEEEADAPDGEDAELEDDEEYEYEEVWVDEEDPDGETAEGEEDEYEEEWEEEEEEEYEEEPVG